MVWHLKHASRALRRQPAFSFASILCLAIGIGAATVVFSLLNGLLLQPLQGIAHLDELLYVHVHEGGSYPNYEEIRDSGIFEEIAAYTDGIMALAPEPSPVDAETTLGMTVTGSYFPVLGTRAVLGRLLEPADDRPGAAPVVVLSHGYWQHRLGGRADAIGSTVLVNGRPFTVVGVAEPGFVGTFHGFQVDVWVPWTWIGISEPLSEPTRRGDFFLEIAARLPTDVSVQEAQAAADTLTARLRSDHPEVNRALDIELLPTTGVDPEVRTVIVGLIGVLSIAALLLLVLACVPVVNMFLGRGALRARELAVRMALGAGRGHIVGLVLLESLLLGLAGGVVGLLLATWLTRLVSLLEPHLPIRLALDFSPDLEVVLFAVLVSLATGGLFGLVPALRLARADLRPALEGGTLERPGSRFPVRKILVVAQVAVAAVLLIVGGLFVRTVRQSRSVEAGFDPSGLWVVPRMDLTLVDKSPDEALELYRQMVERAESLPGIETASVTTQVPLNPLLAGTARVELEGLAPSSGERDGGDELFEVDFARILPGFFETMGISVLRGRGITELDRPEGQKVAVVNETLARRFFDGDAIGRSLRVVQDVNEGERRVERYRIAGVVENGKYRNLADVGSPYFYVALAQAPPLRAHLVFRSRSPVASPAPMLARALGELEPGLPIQQPQTVSQFIELALLPQRVTASLSGAMGVVGLFLAAVGIYGVVAFSVEQRRRELGIRMSLGASGEDLVRMIVMEGGRLSLLGLVIGLGGAAAVSQLLRGMLHGIRPIDPVTYVVIATILALTALGASLLPAVRAARVDATRSLRQE